jgi:hypothetical protein
VAIRGALGKLGWIEGRNLQIVTRWGKGGLGITAIEPSARA